MNDKELKKLVDSEFEKVGVPAGLEDRLSATIDSLASEGSAVSERDGSTRQNVHRTDFNPARKWISIAASVAILAVAGSLFAIRSDRDSARLADTCRTPEEAYAETERALQMMSDAYGKGMKHVNASASRIIETQKTIEGELMLKKHVK